MKGERGRKKKKSGPARERENQRDNNYLSALQFVLVPSIGFRLMLWPGQMGASLLSYLDAWTLFLTAAQSVSFKKQE